MLISSICIFEYHPAVRDEHDYMEDFIREIEMKRVDGGSALVDELNSSI